jgi:hypothetical protein
LPTRAVRYGNDAAQDQPAAEETQTEPAAEQIIPLKPRLLANMASDE